MKTKEEIMMEHCSDNGLLSFNLGKHILAAMQEYADDKILRTELSFLYKYSERIGLDAETRIEEINNILK